MSKKEQVLGMDEKALLTVIAFGLLGASLLAPMMLGMIVAKTSRRVFGGQP